jgi:hypothetical protein
MVDEKLRKRIIERAKSKLGVKILTILEAVALQEYIEELEAAQHRVQADLAITCDKCGDLAQYPVCACGNPIPRPPNR